MQMQTNGRLPCLYSSSPASCAWCKAEYHSCLMLLLTYAADSLLAAILWSVITYYPVGLAPEASRFFTFVLILFVVHSMVGRPGHARVLSVMQLIGPST